ncbi:MAG: VanW family protein [Thermoleophilia bacterium]|nr:VanW family protein [Thermoleophilia bacterium]
MGDSVKATSRRRYRARRWTFLVIAALVVVVGLAIVVDTALYHDEVHGGVKVAGLSLGGLTEEEATAALTTHVAQAQTRPVSLIGAGRTFEITLGRAGIRVDIPAAVEAAMAVTRESNFIVDLARRCKLYFTDTDLPLKGLVNDAKMDVLLDEIGKAFDIVAVPTGLVFDDGEVRVVEGRKGGVVDRALMREKLIALLTAPSTTDTRIPMMIDEPPVLGKGSPDLARAAETMVSAPLTLTFGERSWTFSPADIAVYLDLAAETKNGVATLVPVFSSSKLSPLLKELSGIVYKAPVNATFKSDGSKAWAVLGKMGRELDVEGTLTALTETAQKSSKRTVEVVVAEVEPELTAKKAEAMGIHTALATYKTVYDCPPERQQNVRVTTQYADKIMAPGEVYNFDKQIGPRTEERGFALAPGIVGKGTLEDVLGGGICQVSTTLFNAVFEAGLEIIERHNHSLYIDHYPPGRDATVTDSLKTLKFRNDTDHYIWVHGWSNGIVTIFTIYGTDDGRKVEWSWSGWEFGEKAAVEKYTVAGLSPGRQVIERAGQDARSCTVTRKVTMPDGTVLHNGPETYKSEFKMIPRIIQVGAQPTTTTTAMPGGIAPGSTESTVAPSTGTTTGTTAAP